MPKDATSRIAAVHLDDELGHDQDRLEYLADHLLELQSLAAGSGGTTLNGLLMLAYQEALLQSRRLVKAKA